MAKEVEMKDATEAPKSSAHEASPAADHVPPPSVQDQLASNVKLIEKAVKQKETRALFSKLLRQTQAIRKRCRRGDIQALLASVFPAAHPSKTVIAESIDSLEHTMETDEIPADTPVELTIQPLAGPLPEVEMYAFLLAIMKLIDAKQWSHARALATAAVERLGTFNRRTLDVLGARLWFYVSLTSERLGVLPEVRSALLAAHRASVLRHDEIGQETLLNLLLRDYLLHNLYDQAEALRSKAQRDGYRSAQQHCRVLYYQGRIRAVQLEYSDAKDCLAQALRKAPNGARGFRGAVMKWLVVVRLLLGEIPDRAELATPELRRDLAPYLDLAHAVRGGDLQAFAAVAVRHEGAFHTDGTRHLIGRLRANVIRAGLRRVAGAYSRISLADVASKLGLASTEDAEFVVAKAIRDGWIAAVLDHDAGVVVASRGADVYSTDEPQAAFHARIAFCMEVHNDAQRAMRFDPRPAQDWDDANALRERQDQELQAALEEDDMEF